MRHDMTKVVAEPARGGSSFRVAKGEKVRLQREGLDSVQREGMGRRWQHYDRRSSRDHLNALRRFLHKQVGRPWDQVYSEFCHHAPVGSFLGHHLRELLSYEVSSDVTVRDDGMYGRRGWRVYNGDLYVCPETNILKVFDDGSRRKRYRWRPRSEYEMLAIDDTHKYVKLDGLWYKVTLATIPGGDVSERPFDVVLKLPLFHDHTPNAPGVRVNITANRDRCMRVWGGLFYASAKAQASSREVRRIEGALAEGAAVFAAPRRRGACEKHYVRRGSCFGGGRH